MKDKHKSHLNRVSHQETGSSTFDSKKVQSRRSTNYDRPTPLDFDAFIPWVCMEWQSPEVVVVTRMLQEEYKKHERRTSSSRSKSNKSLRFQHGDNESAVGVKKSNATSGVTDPTNRSSIYENAVPIKAYYDTKDHLVEISIIGCPFEIHRKVIQAVSLCLPFHSLLTKLTIRRGGLTNVLIHEIAKMLPHSNLTDICLDDCNVPQGKYDDIFTHTSQLKYLSLNRCNIGDAMCKAIAEKIDFGAPGSTLLILELGSNLISDKGANALAETLRRNRRLLHLNLSGNKITDTGTSSILSHLMEYEMTWDEVVDARQRKLKYTEKKMEVYASCYEDVLKRQKADLLDLSFSNRKSSKLKNSKNVKEDARKKPKKNASMFVVEEKSAIDIANDMTMGIVGKFIDPYDEDNVVKKNGGFYSKGNMVLCSLNLAYNNLTYISIKKVYNVLKYQDRIDNEATGLLRIVFDGNYIPDYCMEYSGIEMFLKKAVKDNGSSASTAYNKRTLSASASRRS